MLKRCAVVLVLLLATLTFAQAPGPSGMLRTRPYTLVMSPQAASVTLDLFDDVRLSAVKTHLTPRALNRPGFIWHGVVQGEPFSRVALLWDDSGLRSGEIVLPGRAYTLTATTVTEIDSGARHSRQAVRPVNAAARAPSTPREDDGSSITLLVLYTQNAQAIAGGTPDAIETAIEGAVALANTTFADSGIATQLTLVHIAPVFYLEQPNVSFDADLINLTGSGDGYVDDAHTLRDQYRADLVLMVAGTWFNNYCGTAWLPVPLDAAYGFSIVEARCLDGVTLAHQVGHNLGSAHDRANAGSPPVLPYAYGYQDPATGPGDSADFVTLMALNTGGACPPLYTPGVCPVIPRWSNPQQTYDGKPLGVDANAPDGADNALAVGLNAVVVANYRSAAPGSLELLTNGGMELDADADRVPDFWAPSGLAAGDGVLCAMSVPAPDGVCAVKLAGGQQAQITQAVSGAGWTSGAALSVSALVRRKKAVSGGSLRLKVLYSDAPTSKLKVNIAPGSGDYAPVTGVHVLSGSAHTIKLTLRYQGASGALYFDAASLRAQQ